MYQRTVFTTPDCFHAVFSAVERPCVSPPRALAVDLIHEPVDEFRSSTSPDPYHCRVVKLTNEQLEIMREPLVMASEIGGLDPLHGYLKHGNLVVDADTVSQAGGASGEVH